MERFSQSDKIKKIKKSIIKHRDRVTHFFRNDVTNTNVNDIINNSQQHDTQVNQVNDTQVNQVNDTQVNQVNDTQVNQVNDTQVNQQGGEKIKELIAFQKLSTTVDSDFSSVRKIVEDLEKYTSDDKDNRLKSYKREIGQMFEKIDGVKLFIKSLMDKYEFKSGDFENNKFTGEITQRNQMLLDSHVLPSLSENLKEYHTRFSKAFVELMKARFERPIQENNNIEQYLRSQDPKLPHTRPLQEYFTKIVEAYDDLKTFQDVGRVITLEKEVAAAVSDKPWLKNLQAYRDFTQQSKGLGSVDNLSDHLPKVSEKLKKLQEVIELVKNSEEQFESFHKKHPITRWSMEILYKNHEKDFDAYLALKKENKKEFDKKITETIKEIKNKLENGMWLEKVRKLVSEIQKETQLFDQRLKQMDVSIPRNLDAPNQPKIPGLVTKVENDIENHQNGEVFLGRKEIDYYQNLLSKCLGECHEAKKDLTQKKKKLEKYREDFNDKKSFYSEQQLKLARIHYQTELEYTLKFTVEHKSSPLTRAIDGYAELEKRCVECHSKLQKILDTYDQQVASDKAQSIDRIYTGEGDILPNMERVNVFQKKLELFFPYATDKDKIEEIANATDVLQNKTYCKKVLVDLQNKMKELRIPLEQALRKSEQELGFKEPRLVKDLVEPKDFQEMLRSGEPFVDMGAGPFHGSFSHRLQWYILGRAKHDDLLKMETVKLYHAMGEEQFLMGNEVNTVWDLVVDVSAGGRGGQYFLGIDKQTKEPDKMPSHRRAYMIGYNGPVFLIASFFEKDFPAGPLKEEIQLEFLRWTHFEKESVESTEHLLEAIRRQIIPLEKDKITLEDKTEKMIKDTKASSKSDLEYSIHNLYNDYIVFQPTSLLASYKDNASYSASALEKINKLINMDLNQLENYYGELGRKLPSEYDLHGDYLAERNRIINENKSDG